MALTLGKWSWTCPTCGAMPDRDDNADDLRRLGLAALSDAHVPEELREWERWIGGACRLSAV